MAKSATLIISAPCRSGMALARPVVPLVCTSASTVSPVSAGRADTGPARVAPSTAPAGTGPPPRIPRAPPLGVGVAPPPTVDKGGQSGPHVGPPLDDVDPALHPAATFPSHRIVA